MQKISGDQLYPGINCIQGSFLLVPIYVALPGCALGYLICTFLNKKDKPKIT